jgi:BirA family biotin operon repressor/biotin-[acetyl-CoA-carboxylase] ligase
MARSSLPPPNSKHAREASPARSGRIAAAKPPLEHAPIIRLESVDSTQSYAAKLAEDGAVDGTAVVAETQTNGRGRRGRVWHDAPGESLLMSVILRTSLPVVRLPLLSLAASVAVAEALREVGGVDARLKWPNDVHVRGRKIAGILLERRGDVVVLGIGVNMVQRELVPELAAVATSLALEDGRTDREALLSAVLDGVAQWRNRLERDGFASVRARWSALATTPGRQVSVDGVAGVARGLDDDGALVIENAGGTTRVLAGDVLELR